MTALDVASAVKAGDSVQWRELELAAFQGQAAVQGALDPKRKYPGYGPHPMGRALRIAVISIVALAPVWSWATLLGDRFNTVQVNAEVAVPVASLIMAVGLVVPAWMVVAVIRERSVPQTDGLVIAAVYLVIGVLQALLASARSEGTAVSPAWLLPFVAWALFGLAGVLWSLPALWRGQAATTVSSRKQPLVAARRAIAKLSEAEQARVRGELHKAIENLAERSVITPEDADWALRAELGLLAVRMSQRRDEDVL